MNLSPDQLSLLDDISDDWYGLWEVDWYFNGAHPNWSFEERQKFLSVLVSQELVEIFYGRLGVDGEPFPFAPALAAICDSAIWLPRSHSDDQCYYAFTTEAGNEALKRAAGSQI